jgi:hypothetical protein
MVSSKLKYLLDLGTPNNGFCDLDERYLIMEASYMNES